MAYNIRSNTLKSGDTTYYIVQSCRIPGTKNSKHELVVEKFSHNDLLNQGHSDPRSFIETKLLALREMAKNNVSSVSVNLDLNKKLELKETGGIYQINDDSKNIGYTAYSKLYHLLELDEFVNNRRNKKNYKYNVNVILQHLIYSRLLYPDSKLDNYQHRERFFGNTSYGLQDVYRSMDTILEWRDDLLRHIDNKIQKIYSRKGSIIFYDVTNYFFETDEDEKDGLRQRGVSKEHRPNPIVQVGLFMDELGLPITYELHKGNTNDCKTFSESLDKSIIEFQKKSRIIVADKGMMTYENILKIRRDKNGYVISQSIRKSDSDTKDFALDNNGWKHTIDKETGEIVFSIKERTLPRTAASYGVDEKKHTGSYNERQVFIWSKKYSDRAKAEREEVIRKANERCGKKSKDYKMSSYGSAKYLSKSPVVDGKTVNADSYTLSLNLEAIEEDEKYDGYYLICTNVIGTDENNPVKEDKDPYFAYYRSEDGFFILNHEVPAEEIVGIYGGLWKIEETFKVTKTGMMNTRPVFHYKEERIRAHFLICFVALVIERLLEMQLSWSYSSKQIQQSLSSFVATLIPNSNCYTLPYYDEVVENIINTLSIGIENKILSAGDIRKIIGNTKKKSYET